MTGLTMEFHQPAHCTRILWTAGECLSGGPNAGLRDPPNTTYQGLGGAVSMAPAEKV